MNDASLRSNCTMTDDVKISLVGVRSNSYIAIYEHTSTFLSVVFLSFNPVFIWPCRILTIRLESTTS